MEPLLLIDTNYMCHRAWHAVGSLAHGDMGTGAVYGVLREIVSLQAFFRTSRCAFAFDPRGPGKRLKLHPGYKGSRRAKYAEETDAEKEARADFHHQIQCLREDYLTAAGFSNVFMADGYEADDIIARIAADLPEDDEAIIVGSDQDLWQCLRPNVWCWNPHKKRAYTLKCFRRQWGLHPRRWPDVKALAGCKSDDIPGVPGVGEATAVKFLRRTLGPHTKAAAALRASRDVYEANIKLVRLPFPGTPEFILRPDTITEEKWQALADRLGMRSLRDNMPRGVETKLKGRRRGNNQEGFGIGRS